VWTIRRVYICPGVLRSRGGGGGDIGANIVGFGKDGEDMSVFPITLELLKVLRCFEVKSGMNDQEALYVLWTSSPRFECGKLAALDRHVGF
jgi:hypothetical protein